MKEELMKTGDRLIVEASPYDKIWGIGLYESEAVNIPEEEWNGLNLLGKVMVKLREEFKNE